MMGEKIEVNREKVEHNCARPCKSGISIYRGEHAPRPSSNNISPPHDLTKLAWTVRY